jgi:hypothetical protein
MQGATGLRGVKIVERLKRAVRPNKKPVRKR